MKSRASTLALSAVAWIGFNAVMLWTAAFLADMAGPRTVDARMRTDPVIALLTDVGLLLMFGVQHSVMARAGVKSTMRRVIPVALERTVYLLATEVCLVLLMLLWQPIDGQLWQVSGPAALVLWGLCAVGWALATWSTYAVDHLELTGLRQSGWTPARAPEDVRALQTRGLYAVVRHPLMTGLLLAFWATPHMGRGHLVFAAGSTAYILLGVCFEERDLRREFGGDYEAYAQRVRSLLPLPSRHWSSPRARGGPAD